MDTMVAYFILTIISLAEPVVGENKCVIQVVQTRNTCHVALSSIKVDPWTGLYLN